MLTVAIPVFQRHDLLERCLTSLRACPEFDYRDVFLLLVPEHGEDRGALFVLCNRLGFPLYEVALLPERRLYCDGNTLRARDLAFANTTATHVLTLDSDVQVSPSFLTTLLGAERWITETHGQPCYVQSSISCVNTPVVKQQLLGALVPGPATGCHHLMRRAVYERLRPVWDEFRTRFLDKPPTERACHEQWLWMASLAHSPDPWSHERLLPYRHYDCGLAHDAVTYVAALRHGILPAHTAVNYALHLGDVGENTTPEMFVALQRVKLDMLPAPSSFRWWPTPHPLTCLPRET